jgi:DNA-binding NarL/FixJ family response regulator
MSANFKAKPEPQPDPPVKRIAVADDHPVLREGVMQLINRQPGLACCGEAATPQATLELVESQHPDLLLLDLRLGNSDGLDLIKSLRSRFPGTLVLVFSQFEEDIYAERVLRAGAAGYLMKREASEELISAIRTALDGDLYVSRKMAVLVMRRVLSSQSPVQKTAIDRLSDRELQVFQMLGAGLRIKQIAAEIGLSSKTIETYRENLKHKLGLDCASELVAYAVQWLQETGGDAALPPNPQTGASIPPSRSSRR